MREAADFVPRYDDLNPLVQAGFDAFHSWINAGQPEPAKQWFIIWLTQRREDYCERRFSKKDIEMAARCFAPSADNPLVPCVWTKDAPQAS